MRKVWQEFKDFAFKGNVIDMAVGVVVGGAFSKIVTSLVADIITPLVGLITGGTDLKNLKYVFTPATETVAESALNYGQFIQNIIDFFIIAFSIFMFVKLIATARKKFERKAEAIEEAKEEPKSPTTEELLSEIRDILKENK
ncbi:MAG: large-conductance mechanosensitive channel protein MscL [Clostridia bacterium]|nr:large-conductance mechanosensitive channel protein MscL [Clostridia bacterium]